MKYIWEGIINLKEEMEQYPATISYCYLNYTNGQISINQQTGSAANQVLILLEEVEWSIPAKQATIRIQDFFKLIFLETEGLSTENILFLKKYLPYCFLSIFAKQKERAITVAHFAQTLDGKIATASGHSKWIGNQENLLHAHRMRALCQGVLVGSRTLENDQPQLTVRHVSGSNPIRIIIGHPQGGFDCLLDSSDAPILVLHHRDIDQSCAVEYEKVPMTKNGLMDAKEILVLLYKLGIHSVYVEGGAMTTSHFLNTQMIDILQLHIAPLIFGSGTSAIELPSIEKVQDALQFDHFCFHPFGDSMMFTGSFSYDN